MRLCLPDLCSIPSIKTNFFAKDDRIGRKLEDLAVKSYLDVRSIAKAFQSFAEGNRCVKHGDVVGAVL